MEGKMTISDYWGGDSQILTVPAAICMFPIYSICPMVVEAMVLVAW